MTLQYAVIVTEVRDLPSSSSYEPTYRVLQICNEGEIERPSKGLVRYILLAFKLFCWSLILHLRLKGMGMALSLNLTSTLSTLTSSTFGSLQSPPAPSDTVKEDELSSDNDEPLLSGSGLIDH